MSKSTSHAASSPAIDLRGSFGEFVSRTYGAVLKAFQVLTIWQQRVSDRNHLSQMPHYLLRDMGLGPQDVNDETAKPFWRA